VYQTNLFFLKTGAAFALWLDDAFGRGTSEANAVFGNPKSLMGHEESFQCVSVEIWSFVLPRLSYRNKPLTSLSSMKNKI
jgi:hypothetical protein